MILVLPLTSIVAEILTAQTEPIKDVREGDVIFQTSQSQQSPLIQIATRSKISHCGIIVMKNGKLYVFETLKTLIVTPLDKFIARVEDGKYWLKRSQKENIKSNMIVIGASLTIWLSSLTMTSFIVLNWYMTFIRISWA